MLLLFSSSVLYYYFSICLYFYCLLFQSIFPIDFTLPAFFFELISFDIHLSAASHLLLMFVKFIVQKYLKISLFFIVIISDQLVQVQKD